MNDSKTATEYISRVNSIIEGGSLRVDSPEEKESLKKRAAELMAYADEIELTGHPVVEDAAARLLFGYGNPNEAFFHGKNHLYDVARRLLIEDSNRDFDRKHADSFRKIEERKAVSLERHNELMERYTLAMERQARALADIADHFSRAK